MKWVYNASHLDEIIVLKNSLWEAINARHTCMSLVLHYPHGTCKYCKYIPTRM